MAPRSSNRHEAYGGNGEKTLANVTFAGKSPGAALRLSDRFLRLHSLPPAPLMGHKDAGKKKPPDGGFAKPRRERRWMGIYIGVTRVGPEPLITCTRWPTLMGTSASCATTRVSPLSRRTVIS